MDTIENMTREELINYVKKNMINKVDDTTEYFFKSVAKYTYVTIICANIISFILQCFMIFTGMLKYEKKIGNMSLKSDSIFRLGMHTIEYFRSQRIFFIVKVPQWKTFIKTNQYKGYAEGSGIEQSSILRTHITYSKIVSILGIFYLTGLILIGMEVFDRKILTNSSRQNAQGLFAIILFNTFAFVMSSVAYWMMVKELIWWDIMTTIPIRMPAELLFKAHGGTKIITMEGLIARKELTDDYNIDGMGMQNKAFSVDFFENAKDTKNLDKPDQFMHTTIIIAALICVVMANVFTCSDSACIPQNQVALNAVYVATLSTAIQTFAYAVTMLKTTKILTKASRIYYDVFTKHQYVPKIQVGTRFYSVNYALFVFIFQPTILEVWIYFVFKTKGDITNALKKYTQIENNLRKNAEKPQNILAKFGQLNYTNTAKSTYTHTDCSYGFTKDELTVMSNKAEAVVDIETQQPYFWNDDGTEKQLHDIACATALQCICTIEKLSKQYDRWKKMVLISVEDIETITGIQRLNFTDKLTNKTYFELNEQRWWGMLKLVFAADIANRIIRGLNEYTENIAEVRRIILDTTELKPIIEWWDAPLNVDPEDYIISQNMRPKNASVSYDIQQKLENNIENNVRKSRNKPMYKIINAMFEKTPECISNHTKIKVGHIDDILEYIDREHIALIVQ